MSDRPYVQTYTAVVGNHKCNAKCPYCVSKMTPKHKDNDDIDVNWKNFDKGSRLAKNWGASTFLITSKGEATLYPEKILEFIKKTNDNYPIIELQTNGLALQQLDQNGWLDKWHEAGLTTIALSSVHYDTEINRQIISKDYPNLEETVRLLKKPHRSFCVRMCVILIKDGIDSFKKVTNLVQNFNKMDIDQIKIYPVNKPANSNDEKISNWIDENKPDDLFCKDLKRFLDVTCTPVRKLAHGDTVYSWKDKDMLKDQNIAYGSCLTENDDKKEIRQLIYCRDGHIRYSWQYRASILF